MKTYHIICWGLLTAACFLPSPARSDSSVVATVGGTPITAAEIEQALRLPLYDLEVEKYRLTRRKLDQTIVERLLARAAGERGQTVTAYVTAEVQAQIATITPEEIAARVRADRAKLPPEAEQAHKEARSALVRERAGRALQELVERLSSEAQVTVTLRSPEPPVLTIPLGDGPTWGSPAGRPDHSLGRRPDVGVAGGAGHDRRVRGFRVSGLQGEPPGLAGGAQPLSGAGPDRLPELSPRIAPAGAPGGRSSPLCARAGPVLGLSRRPLCQGA